MPTPGQVRARSAPSNTAIPLVPRAVILCADEEQHLHRPADACPKAMLEVGGQPALACLLELCRYHGITEVAIHLHHRPEAIPTHFGDGRDLGMRIHYLREEILLGSAGALRPLRVFLDRTFFVLYGDVLTNMDLTAMLRYHYRRGAMATVALRHVLDPQRRGLVEMGRDGRVQRFVETPPPGQVSTDLISAGVALLEPALLARLPAEGPLDLCRDFFPRLLEAGVALYGFPLRDDEYLVDLSTPEDLARAQREWPAIWAAGPVRR